MVIRSNQNERFKSWKKLKTRKGRKRQQAFLVEGIHLVEEALKANWPIEELIQSTEFSWPHHWTREYPHLLDKKTIISANLFAELAETENPQGIALKVALPQPLSKRLLFKESNFLVLVDGVQDPGNLGTIIRTADAAGIDGLVLGRGTVDPFSSKVLRSTQGSIFHLPIIELDLKEGVADLLATGWHLFATALRGAEDYRLMDFTTKEKIALIVGNEAKGIEESLLTMIPDKIKIPIWGKAESLNVSIATGILLYHIQAQKKQERGGADA